MKTTLLFYRFLTRIFLPLSLCCFFGFTTSCEGEIEPPYTISQEMQAPFPQTIDFENRSGGWSPDGKKVVYQAYHGWTPTVEIYDFATGEITVVGAGYYMFDLRWSPDGEHILGENGAIASDLLLLSLQDLSVVRITGPGTNINPYRQARYRLQWHPSNGGYAFHAAGATAMGVPYAIYTAHLDGSGFRMIVENLASFVFKNSNTIIVAESTDDLGWYQDEEGYTGAYYWEVDYHSGAKVGKFLEVPPSIMKGNAILPFSYSSSLNMIVFSGDGFYLASPEGHFYQLTHRDEVISLRFPRFSPEGKRILFHATVRNGLGHPYNLFIYDVASQTIERMLPDEITYSDSSLAVPDGQPKGTSLNQRP